MKTQITFFLASLLTCYGSISDQNLVASSSFRCPSSTVEVFPASEQKCSKSYYLCVNYVASQLRCPGITVYDASSGKCSLNISCFDAPSSILGSTDSIVPITSRNPSTITQTQTNSPIISYSNEQQQTSFSCLMNGNYRNPNDCHTFFMCSNGDLYMFDCPANLVYNPASDSCDWPQNVPGC